MAKYMYICTLSVSLYSYKFCSVKLEGLLLDVTKARSHTEASWYITDLFNDNYTTKY